MAVVDDDTVLDKDIQSEGVVVTGTGSIRRTISTASGLRHWFTIDTVTEYSQNRG